MTTDLDEGKWKTESLQMEAPALLVATARSTKEPVQIIAHYSLNTAWSDPRTLWVSYRIPQIARRVCIYTKISISGTLTGIIENIKGLTKFEYMIFVSEHQTCDNPAEEYFVTENVGDGYRSDWKLIHAQTAFTKLELAYTLNVYIFGYDQDLDKQDGQKIQGGGSTGDFQFFQYFFKAFYFFVDVSLLFFSNVVLRSIFPLKFQTTCVAIE